MAMKARDPTGWGRPPAGPYYKDKGQAPSLSDLGLDAASSLTSAVREALSIGEPLRPVPVEYRAVKIPVPSTSTGGGDSGPPAEWRPKWQFSRGTPALWNLLGNAELMTPIGKGNTFQPDPDYQDPEGYQPPQREPLTCWIDNIYDFRSAIAKAKRDYSSRTYHSQRSRGADPEQPVVQPHVPQWYERQKDRDSHKRQQLKDLHLRVAPDNDGGHNDSDGDVAVKQHHTPPEKTSEDADMGLRMFYYPTLITDQLEYGGFSRPSPSCMAYLHDHEVTLVFRVTSSKHGLYEQVYVSDVDFYERLDCASRHEEDFIFDDITGHLQLTDDAVYDSLVMWFHEQNEFRTWSDGDLEKLFHWQNHINAGAMDCVSEAQRALLPTQEQPEQELVLRSRHMAIVYSYWKSGPVPRTNLVHDPDLFKKVVVSTEPERESRDRPPRAFNPVAAWYAQKHEPPEWKDNQKAEYYSRTMNITGKMRLGFQWMLTKEGDILDSIRLPSWRREHDSLRYTRHWFNLYRNDKNFRFRYDMVDKYRDTYNDSNHYGWNEAMSSRREEFIKSTTLRYNVIGEASHTVSKVKDKINNFRSWLDKPVWKLKWKARVSVDDEVEETAKVLSAAAVEDGTVHTEDLVVDPLKEEDPVDDEQVIEIVSRLDQAATEDNYSPGGIYLGKKGKTGSGIILPDSD